MNFKFKPGDDAYHTLWERNCKITRSHHIIDATDEFNAYDIVFPKTEGDFRSVDEASERWLEPKRDYIPE